METMGEPRLTLFYHPASYYSQKVLIALAEKGIDYKSRPINLLKGEQNHSWFLRMNAAGCVPVLRDREKAVLESEVIIEYLDKEFPQEPVLVPDKAKEAGQAVDRWRKKLDELPMKIIFFGVFYHSDLSSSGVKVPLPFRWNRKDIEDILSSWLQQLGAQSEEHVDLREEYLGKILGLQATMTALRDKPRLVDSLDKVENILNDVEEQLQAVFEKGESPFLCGTTHMTAGDITLVVLLARLAFLGLQERFFTPTVHPRLHDYWQKMQALPSCHKVITDGNQSLVKAMVRDRAAASLPVLGGLATLGLAAGLSVFLIHKFK